MHIGGMFDAICRHGGSRVRTQLMTSSMGIRKRVMNDQKSDAAIVWMKFSRLYPRRFHLKRDSVFAGDEFMNSLRDLESKTRKALKCPEYVDVWAVALVMFKGYMGYNDPFLLIQNFDGNDRLLDEEYLQTPPSAWIQVAKAMMGEHSGDHPMIDLLPYDMSANLPEHNHMVGAMARIAEVFSGDALQRAAAFVQAIINSAPMLEVKGHSIPKDMCTAWAHMSSVLARHGIYVEDATHFDFKSVPKPIVLAWPLTILYQVLRDNINPCTNVTEVSISDVQAGLDMPPAIAFSLLHGKEYEDIYETEMKRWTRNFHFERISRPTPEWMMAKWATCRRSLPIDPSSWPPSLHAEKASWERQLRVI